MSTTRFHPRLKNSPISPATSKSIKRPRFGLYSPSSPLSPSDTQLLSISVGFSSHSRDLEPGDRQPFGALSLAPLMDREFLNLNLIHCFSLTSFRQEAPLPLTPNYRSSFKFAPSLVPCSRMWCRLPLASPSTLSQRSVPQFGTEQ